MNKNTVNAQELVEQLRTGAIDRRAFIRRATALGLAPGLATVVAYRVSAQDATPVGEAAEEDIFASNGSPRDTGTENQTRGEGGELRIIQYQAPTNLSPHASTGYKDFDAAQLVVEPLLGYLSDAQLYGVLVDEVPSLENGLLAEDGLSVTFRLKEGLLWSDGEPVTAEDIKFTVEWVLNPDNASTSRSKYEPIAGVEVQDELTAVVTFSEPNPFWFEPFTGYTLGTLYPKHVFEAGGTGAADAFVLKPIGTGPFKVVSFTPNDEIQYEVNENYREANKPFFSSVYLKGGGDGAASARAVLQTGEFDFAWPPGLEPDVMASMMTAEALGVEVPAPPVNVERMAINHSDPNTEVDGQVSEMNTPHPALSDPAVRRAMNLAINRQLIADEFYGSGSTAGVNVVNGDPSVYSPNTSWSFDSAAAAQALDDAGWVMDGDIRAKDGVKLDFVFASAISSRRQKAQAVIKQNLEDIGMRIQLETVDSGIFFDNSVGNDQSFSKFPWDLMLYVMPQGSTRPLSYMMQWYAGPNGENVAQESNSWTGSNLCRWRNDEYDALWQATATETDPTALIEKFIALNDLVVNDDVLVPVVLVGGGSLASNKLRLENLIAGGFSGAYVNIANWNFAD